MVIEKKHRNSKGLMSILVVVLSALVLVPVYGLRPDDDRQRRADYIYMEALRQNALGNHDAYYTLLERASALSPDETAISSDLGFYDIAFFGKNDSTLAINGLKKMKDHFDTHPDDYYSSLSYGALVGRIGDVMESVRVWSKLDSLYPTKKDVAFSLAQALTAVGDTTSVLKAISVFDRLERATGHSLMISGNRANAYLMLGDTVNAIRQMTDLARETPNDITALLAAGDIYMALNIPDSAITYFDRACELDSTSGPAFYKRASYYQATGDTVRYENEIVEALQKDNLELNVKLELLRVFIADIYQDSVRRPQIESLFATVLDDHPHEVDVHKLYASYLVAVKDFAGAAEQQSYALDIDPSKIEEWMGLFSLYASAGDYKKQLEAGQSALRYFPDDPRANWYVAIAYLQNEDYKSGIAQGEKALDLAWQKDSTDRALLSDIACTIGDAFYKENKVDSAFMYYEKSLTFNPDNLLALNNCAYYLACENRELDRAEEMCAQVIAKEPDNPTSLDTYAWVFFKKHEYKSALEFIERALELEDEPSAELYHHAGDIYFMTGDRDKAVENWKEALRLEPENDLLQRKIKHKTFFYE
ncbi:MAG: tetratricopeptide repeat protein [Muribaculaceae bacterium]|nr:tetratricopeptide repeat protein [Muribaculaceae bacterium]